jgi:hypothetical protein
VNLPHYELTQQMFFSGILRPVTVRFQKYDQSRMGVTDNILIGVSGPRLPLFQILFCLTSKPVKPNTIFSSAS